MGLLNITEMVRILKKYFLQIVALSLVVGLLGGFVVTSMQTYTCTLGFKYNHKGAEEGLAPDGESKLDPYEIQNPVVIKAALEDMGVKDDGADGLSVKGIRQDISINKVITELDKEVSESAALLGEKYDVAATEYEMKFTYDASLGDEFGPRMFSNIIKERPDGKGGTMVCDTFDNCTIFCTTLNADGDEIPLTFETKRMEPGSTNRWFFEIFGTECSAKFSSDDANAFHYTSSWGKEQSWNRIIIGYKPMIPTITGPIFEFGFTDAIQQQIAAFMLEYSGVKVPSFGYLVN